ncbi:unnamed protein product [Paramecium pentaurelia]|uniref:Uncharacterized protein n=1 Tax=Paramecium pentaurelia TaxID=43138 RepID=A0A8S1VUA4_9CILI|nr:unnamed protein product [Paramecium pentaurelia]
MLPFNPLQQISINFLIQAKKYQQIIHVQSYFSQFDFIICRRFFIHFRNLIVFQQQFFLKF